MKAIDTNVLIRFLVRDDEKQAKRVYGRLKEAEREKEVLFVPLLVVLETLWVLESVYEIPRQEILDSIDELLLMPVLQFENPTVIVGFISSARATTLDLPDLLIAHSALRSGCESIITFDRKASKSELFELMK
jgi:predicted nucleic-acid-binding protein